jgi:hypothetical protein
MASLQLPFLSCGGGGGASASAIGGGGDNSFGGDCGDGGGVSGGGNGVGVGGGSVGGDSGGMLMVVMRSCELFHFSYSFLISTIAGTERPLLKKDSWIDSTLNFLRDSAHVACHFRIASPACKPP